MRIDPSLNAVFAWHKLQIRNGQRLIAPGVACGIEDCGRKWLGNRHRGRTGKDNAVAMLGKRSEQPIVVAGLDRRKTGCRVIEDDVESDGLRSALEQTLEQLGVIGAE